jgi:regulator of nucleoside diphosphate kinase
MRKYSWPKTKPKKSHKKHLRKSAKKRKTKKVEKVYPIYRSVPVADYPPPFYCGDDIMFESSNTITLLCKSDYERLTKLSGKLNERETHYGKGHPKLAAAVVVDDHMFPDDRVRIGIRISLKDLGTGSVAKFLLCDNTDKHRDSEDGLRAVSVTSPLGAALLGTGLGEHIKWTLPNGHTRYLRVFELAEHVDALSAIQAR